MSERLVFIDIETGGFRWWPDIREGKLVPMHPIIQIAAIACDKITLEPLETFEKKIRFKPEYCEPKALEVNGYTEEAWKLASHPIDVCHMLADFLRNHATLPMVSKKTGGTYYVAQLVGHNISNFDMPFLVAWFKNFNAFMPASFQPIDTMQIALIYKQIFIADFPNLKLNTLAEKLGCVAPTHDALFDVKATIQVYDKLMRGFFPNNHTSPA